MFQTMSNLLYLLPAFEALKRRWYFLSCYLLLLAITSGAYHFGEWQGDPSRFWRYADVSMIFMVLGAFPASLMRKPSWHLYQLLSIFLVLIKYNVILESWSINSPVLVPIVALPTLVIGYYTIRKESYYSAVIVMIFAFIFSTIGNVFAFDTIGYSVPHGWWHVATAIAFTLMINGAKKPPRKFEEMILEGKVL